MDVFPTLAGAAGVAARNRLPFDGRNLWDAIASNKPVAREDLHFTIESRDGFHFAVRQGEWKLVRHELRPSGEAVNQLYRLDEDPGETKDVAAAHPALVKELAASIEKWRKLHPAQGTRLENRPPAGWKAPSQWAEAARS